MSVMRKRLLTIVMLVAALMIFTVPALAAGAEDSAAMAGATASSGKAKIGRASCRERVFCWV